MTSRSGPVSDGRGHPEPDQNPELAQSTALGGCDTHVHIYADSYPISPEAVLRPPNASIDTYRRIQAELGLQRVVLVQPTTYGLDNSCQIDAAAEFADAARLVVVIDDHTPDSELERLTELGARGARFHMLPGGAVGWDALPIVARRIEPFGWHIQLQLDGRTLPDHLDVLRSLPTPLVIDHVGRFMPPVPVGHEAFAALLGLVEGERCWVKLSAPYESTHDGAPHYPKVTSLADELVRRSPERMLWASNWPHPGQDDPLSVSDLRHLRDAWLPTDELRARVLVDNPATVYGFEPIVSPEPLQETS